ncbi:ER membrane protein complex subunit 4 isoform X2 [Macaca fascicularis]|uniref:ER membrane protein complex subunit 4 isoform X2 n=1 Tax=Macaca fascicularis TaxID=9541 RepID=UPI003D15BB66
MTETLLGARHKGRTALAGTQLSLNLNWLQLLPQLSSVFFRTSVLRDVDRFNKDEEKKRKVVSLATEVWGRSDRGSGQGDSLYPVGYLDKQVPDTSVQETDRILVEKVQSFQDVRKFKPEVSSGFGLSHWEPDGFGVGCLQVPVHGTVTYTCIGLVGLH